jgi:hypothetical protein
MVELTFTLFASVVPIENTLAAIPIAIISAPLLGVLAGLGVKTRFTKNVIAFSTANVLLFFILSCFLPKTSHAVKLLRADIDEWIAISIRGEKPVRIVRRINPPPRQPPQEQLIHRENQIDRTPQPEEVRKPVVRQPIQKPEPVIRSVAHRVGTNGKIELRLSNDSAYTGWVRLDNAGNGSTLVIEQKSAIGNATIEFGNAQRITVANERTPRRITIESADTLLRYVRLKGSGTFALSVELYE